jgi:hypothetical protein
MSIWKRFKQSLNNYLEKMEKANNEVFGGKTPDCCTLNRKNTMGKR